VIVSACVIGSAFAISILVVVARFGTERLRVATMVPLMLILVFLLSGRNGKLLDQMYSSRTLAGEISKIQDVPPTICIYKARRDVQYGLGFYFDHRIRDYTTDGVPDQQHILVVRNNAVPDLQNILAGRSYEPLFSYAPQDLTIYRVFAKN